MNSTLTIVCPHCKIKQTGIIREYTIDGQPVLGVICVYKKCRALISGSELEDQTEPIIQFPSDLKKIKK